MQPKIEHIERKFIIGMRRNMSLAANATAELWRNFRPNVHAIEGRLDQDFISLQNYPAGYFANFNPQANFEKWAGVLVSQHENIPQNMETFCIPEGQYAVFHYKGSSADNRIFEYIFGEWLPNSGYELDDRPHFEILGAKYKNNDPESEEEIWIPIK